MIGERFLVAMASETLPSILSERVRGIATRECLSTLVDSDREIIVTDDRKMQMSVGEEGAIILGDVFFRPSFGSATATLSAKDLAETVRTRGNHLLQRCWGSYVGIFNGGPASQAGILRAPFGRVPVFYTRFEGCLLAASEVDLLLEAGGLRAEINWTMIAQHLCATQLRESATGLMGVEELLPGFRLTLGEGRPTMVWNPVDYCVSRNAASEIVANELRGIVDHCVGAWSKSYDNVVLGVSGGLDSSVVAASAAAAGAAVSCLTLVTRDPAGDEREFASSLTDFLGIELFEFFEDPGEIDVRRSAAAHLPRPTARSFAQSGDNRNLEVARKVGAKAFFTGGGGDNVFCYLTSVSPLVDVLLEHGNSRQAWQTARDISRLTGASLWEVMRRAIARRYGRNRAHVWRMDRSFLSESCPPPQQVTHPWLVAASGLPPGKQAHIALLMYVQNHLDGYGRERILPVISPLLSQPIVEYCLSVPTWQWLEGGWNRAPARRAYRDALPREVLERRSKGTPDSFVIEIFEKHRRAVGEMLMDGLLAQQGYLDVAAIERAVSHVGPALGATNYRLLKLADVEAWLRAWAARG